MIIKTHIPEKSNHHKSIAFYRHRGKKCDVEKLCQAPLYATSIFQSTITITRPYNGLMASDSNIERTREAIAAYQASPWRPSEYSAGILKLLGRNAAMKSILIEIVITQISESNALPNLC